MDTSLNLLNKRQNNNAVFRPPPEAPVFEPTPSEFSDSLAYIAKIRPIIEKTGICKIKPPPGWQPPFAIDVDEFTFIPRIQKINELEATTRVKLNFLNKLWRFWEFQGIPLKIPTVGRKPLDFHQLHKVVHAAGGFEEVTHKAKWGMIVNQYMKTPETQHKNYATVLSGHYEKYLYPFDMFEAGVFTQNHPEKLKDEPTKAVDYEMNYELKKLQFHGAGRKTALPVPIKSEMKDLTETRCLRDRSTLQRATTTNISGEKCKNCGTIDPNLAMVQCSQCYKAFHRSCLLTPVTTEIIGNWRCPICLTKEVERCNDVFGFDQSKVEYTLSEFGEIADKFKERYFGKAVHEVECEDAEREFWRLTGSIRENVTVQYGADIHALTNGSGFPTKRTPDMNDEDEKYIDSQWNLNVMPILNKSILQYVTGDVSGMKVPWCYVGMIFSSFCWHIEDHWSYSINFLHWGEPKTWYGVPSSHAERLERVMKSQAPELFEQSPDLLHHITTQMNPNTLMDNGIPVVRTNQCAGEFIITCPRAYHAGFNQGYNFAEAVNFCPADWLSMGRGCIAAYKEVKRPCVFSHEELICKLAADQENLDMNVAIQTHAELVYVFNAERHHRKRLSTLGCHKAERVKFELLNDDERCCAVCKTTLFLSCLSCSCKPKVLVCMDHVDNLCHCGFKEKVLRYRFTLEELPSVLRALHEKIDIYESWHRRASAALNPAAPEDRVSFAELKRLSAEFRDKQLPEDDVSKSLASAIKDADKCACQAKELTHRRARSKRHTDLAIKSAARRVTVAELKSFISDLSTIVCKIGETDQLVDLLSRTEKFQADAKVILSRGSDWNADDLSKLYMLGVDLDIDLHELEQLDRARKVSQWLQQASELLEEDEPLMSDVEVTHRSGVEIFSNHEIGSPQLKSVFRELSELLRKCKLWDEKALICLQSSPNSSMAAIREILDGSACVKASLPHMEDLSDALRRAEDWSRKAQMILTSEDVVRHKVLESHSMKARQIPVKLEYSEQVNGLLDSVSMWCREAASCFLIAQTDWKLIDILMPRLDTACSPFNMPRKRRRRNGHHAEPPTPTERHEEVLNRLRDVEEQEINYMLKLRQTNSACPGDSVCSLCHDNRVSPIFQCQLCHVWIHNSCLNSFESPLPDKSGVSLCHECRRTNRPKLEVIRNLLIKLKSIPVQFDEGDALQCLTERILKVQSRARSFLNLPEPRRLSLLYKIKNQASPYPLLESSLENQMDHCYSRYTQSSYAPSDWIITEVDRLSLETLLLEADIEETTLLLRLHQDCLEHVNKIKQSQQQTQTERKTPNPQKPVKSEHMNRKPRKARSPRSEKRNATANEPSDEWGDYDENCAAPGGCLLPDDESIGWVQCGACEKWFHFTCISVNPDMLGEDEEYTCKSCDSHKQENLRVRTMEQSQYGSDAESCSSLTSSSDTSRNTSRGTDSRASNLSSVGSPLPHASTAYA